MLNFDRKERYGVEDLVEIMELLRSPDGCPWDREQTHASVRRNLIEEAYEAAEALDLEDKAGLAEELGDVLLQIVFHCQMEREAGGFTLDDVADGVCKKLIYRHPHVFADTQVSGADEVLENWDALKRREKKQETTADAIEAVARSLPALWRAEKICSKAVKADMLPAGADEARKALESAAGALEAPADPEKAVGDMLFAAVRVAKALGVDPEQALTGASDRFVESVKKV
ncbi:MAG: nucleoside triphosphate pyrophosphohydrolase [Oscillospiraceae bacterium]|nr:nucleoside triphosphate pyrophosphohydrolase [Oscillospiraceae bacterium]